MRQEFKNAFGKVYLTVTVDRKNGWVHTNWTGYLTEDNIKAGAQAYTAAVKDSGFTCVLNDTRQILGSWDHSLNWVVNDWGPRAAEAGIQHFALITSPASFAESTAASFYAAIKAFEVQIFDNMPDAETWLRQYSFVKK